MALNNMFSGGIPMQPGQQSNAGGGYFGGAVNFGGGGPRQGTGGGGGGGQYAQAQQNYNNSPNSNPYSNTGGNPQPVGGGGSYGNAPIDFGSGAGMVTVTGMPPIYQGNQGAGITSTPGMSAGSSAYNVNTDLSGGSYGGAGPAQSSPISGGVSTGMSQLGSSMNSNPNMYDRQAAGPYAANWGGGNSSMVGNNTQPQTSNAPGYATTQMSPWGSRMPQNYTINPNYYQNHAIGANGYTARFNPANRNPAQDAMMQQRIAQRSAASNAMMGQVRSQWGNMNPQQQWALAYQNPMVRNMMLQNPGAYGFNSGNDINNMVNNYGYMSDVGTNPGAYNYSQFVNPQQYLGR